MDKKGIDFAETPVTELYGSNSFSDVVMRERLPRSVYKEIKAVQAGERELTLEVAEVVAAAMKDWALERGATHFTHWFQPLTGGTAEKHDSFINPQGDGTVLMDFSGKELIKGEPDASSFPSGGLRATFEARGYTAWDTTSPAFLKEDQTGITLYIPTAFVSYHGEALDKKVPLLRSMEAINKQALRVLRALGNNSSKRVLTTVGPEQEYFLVDKKYYEERLDLKYAGRTLFGLLPPKGQEMEDHYFGIIPERVAAFMKELNAELWKLGVSAKTQHNEVAPNQFEIAVIYAFTNAAVDANQLVMEMLQKVAERHGMKCLLHEKPFAGINGSGKHNNWSMGTDDGINLLDPGDTPANNARFLVFCSAVLRAVDKWAKVLRVSAANTGNDLRLGANEAPPAIISVFLGDQLSELYEKLSKGEKVKSAEGGVLEIGHSKLPKLPKDLTDRNRTSPFAFTGNKFEFRMVPSSDSVAGPNTVLNTAVADVLMEFADRLEKASDLNAEIGKIVAEVWKQHSKVVFNGNGYSEEWIKEAEKRGLPNLKCTVEALPEIVKPDAVALFERHKVLSKAEVESRFVIYLEKYAKQINIEAVTMVNMAKIQIYPAASAYAAKLAAEIKAIKEIAGAAAVAPMEATLSEAMKLIASLSAETSKLEALLAKGKEGGEPLHHAKFYREKVVPQMEALRAPADALEAIVDRSLWPFPTYSELLFKL